MITIRESFGTQDLKHIYFVESSCFNPEDTEDIKELSSFVSEKNYKTYIATKTISADNSDTILGYLACEIRTSHYYVTSVAVLPKYRKLGIAKRLLKQCFEDMPVNLIMCCDIRSSNVPSQHLFEKNGFKKVRDFESVYQDEIGFYYETEPKQKSIENNC